MNRLSFASAFLIFLAIPLTLLTVLSCAGSDSSSTTNDSTMARSDTSNGASPRAARAGASPFVTYDELNILYVKNDGTNTQLGKLLDNRDKKKLVFQIFRDSSGDLRLLVIPSRGQSGYYFLNDTIQPLRSSTTQTEFPDNKNVVLGDLQLSGQPIQTLRDSIGNPDNRPNWKYILFVPEIKAKEDNQTPRTAYVNNYLIYHIMHSDGVPTEPIKDLKATKIGLLELRTLAELNPSPPRRLE